MRPSLPGCKRVIDGNSLFNFIWRVSNYHQLGIALLSILLFLIEAVPLELQRRIVNAALPGSSYKTIIILVCIYAVAYLFEGDIKFGLNVYKSWIGEVATRWLRFNLLDTAPLPGNRGDASEGVQLSIIIAEAEAIGGFVGDSLSQPLLQIGILTTVTAYLIYIQPYMALIISVVFLPQMVFVPAFQNAINRRVAERTLLMRKVSVVIVQTGGTRDDDGTQRSRLQTVFEINMGIYKIKFAMNFVMNLMTQAGYVGIMVLGGYFVVTKQTELGTVVAFLSGLAKINDPWGDLVDWYRGLKTTLVKYDLVKTLLQDVSDRGVNGGLI